MEEKKPRSTADWELIERHYRAGLLSLREIAKEGGVTEGAIRKRAKKDGWTRNLVRTVQHKVDRSVPLAASADELARAGFVYAIYFEVAGERYYKVGMAQHVESRMSGHQGSVPFELRVAIAYYVDNMRKEESVLHYMFGDSLIRGEWFKLSQEQLKAMAERALLV